MRQKENPCAEGNERYRQTVLHNLPQLEKLDNIPIKSEERTDARFGNDLMEEVRENIIDQSEGRRYNLELLDARDYRANDAEDNQYEHQPSQQ